MTTRIAGVMRAVRELERRYAMVGEGDPDVPEINRALHDAADVIEEYTALPDLVSLAKHLAEQRCASRVLGELLTDCQDHCWPCRARATLARVNA